MYCCRIPVIIRFNYSKFSSNVQEFFTDCIENCKDDLKYILSLIELDNGPDSKDEYEMTNVIDMQPSLNQSVELPPNFKFTAGTPSNNSNQSNEVVMKAITTSIGINTDDILDRINKNENIKISSNENSPKAINTSLSTNLSKRKLSEEEKIERATSLDWDLI